MVDQDKQEKYGNLKKTLIVSGIAAVSILIIDTFVLGAPVFSSFVFLYVVVYLLPVTLFSIRNRPKLRHFGYRLVIYTFLVASSFGLHNYDTDVARQRAETIIAAVEAYHSDKGRYPDSLHSLVPEYISEIPQSRIFVSGTFFYLGAPDDPHLMYVDYPPFGRVSWSFKDREWITID